VFSIKPDQPVPNATQGHSTASPNVLQNPNNSESNSNQCAERAELFERVAYKPEMHITAALILDDAQEVREKKELLVRIFTPVSYGLFGFGAILTLLSKLFGAEVVPETE